MTKTAKNQTSPFNSKLPLLLTVMGLESLLVVVLIASIPLLSSANGSTSQNLAWVVGIGLPALFGIGLLAQAIAINRNKNNAKCPTPLLWLATHPALGLSILLAIFIVVMFSLSEFLSPGDIFITQLMGWFGLLFYGWLFSLLLYIVFFKLEILKNKKNRSLAVSLLVVALLWCLITITRIGLQPDSRYWNTAGVPVLAIALAGILLAIIAVDQGLRWLFSKFDWRPKPLTQIFLEVALVLGIWLLASLLWIKAPFSNSFFFYGPLPPDGAFLPNSDARLMDLGGQYLIIGGKLETPYFTEKPFYALFLGLVHYFFGQSYLVTTNIQILFLALFPVGLYLLGKQFAGRLFGVALAGFGIIKEFTALIFTYKISVSNSRLYMTEFPSALLLVMAAVLLVRWLGKTKKSSWLPLAAGGVLGVASYVRSNNVVVFIFCLLFLVLINIRSLKKQIPQLALFTLGALLVILPWSVYTHVNYGKDPITWKVRQALFQRFVPDDSITPEPSSQKLETQVMLASNPGSTPGIQERDTKFEPLPTPTNPSPDGLVPLISGDRPQADSDLAQIPQETPVLYRNKVMLILGHFFNNEVKALFTLPFQIFPQKPTLVLNQEYWREPVTWAGQLPPEQILAFACNLIFICLGVAFAWKKLGWAGLVPLVFNISYYLSNALVRTSGSRYLLPADWTVYFYYLLGIWSMLVFCKVFSQMSYSKKAPINQELSAKKRPWLPAFSGVCLLLIGLSLPLLNLTFPTLYHDETKQAVLNLLPLEKIQDEIGIAPEVMQAFASKPYAVLLYGKGIYPGYFRIKENPVIVGNTFTILTPTRYDVLIGDGSEPQEPLPAGEDMIVVGCQHAGDPYIDAYLGYFVQSDKLIWSTTTTFRDICP